MAKANRRGNKQGDKPKAVESTPPPVPVEAKPEKKPEPRVALVNLSGHPLDLNLEHAAYCKSGKCACAKQDTIRWMRAARGEPEVARKVTLRLPRSINVPAKGESEPVLATALDCVEVKQAMKVRPARIRVRNL